MDPRLSDLLQSLFSENELRRWLFTVDRDLLKHVPERGTPAEIFDAATDLLRRRGHVDIQLFQGLIAAVPRRRADIRRVAAELDFPTPEPIDRPGSRRPSATDATASEPLRRALALCMASAAASILPLGLVATSSPWSSMSDITTIALLLLLLAPGLCYTLCLRAMFRGSARSARALWLVWPLWAIAGAVWAGTRAAPLASLLGAGCILLLLERASGRQPEPGTRPRVLGVAAVSSVPALFATKGVANFWPLSVSIAMWQIALGVVLWWGFLRAAPRPAA